MYDFGVKFRLKKKSDIQSLVKSGKFIRFKSFNVLLRKESKDFSQIAISVSRKSGNAVVRNKVKRTIRENFRCSGIKENGLQVLFMLKKKKIDMSRWQHFSVEMANDFDNLEEICRSL